MKRFKSVLLLSTLIILSIVFLLGFDIGCLVKITFHIPCPGCGLTRAFREIINFNIINSINYNILAIPLFIFLIYSFVAIFVDLVKNTNQYVSTMNRIFRKYYLLIIIIILMSWITNIIRGI